MSVALVILHAERMRHTVICVLFVVAKPTKYTSHKTVMVFYHSIMYMLYARVVGLVKCFSTAGPRPGTGTWHQLYRAARGLRKLQYAK